MIKNLLSIFLTFILSISSINAQTVRAALGPGSTANRVAIYLKSNATVTSLDNISTLQFNIGVPDASPTPNLPTITLSNVVGAPPASWTVDPVIVEGGFKQFNITTIIAPISQPFTANTEFIAMELDFGAPVPVDIALITLPDAGANFQCLFYCTGTPTSDGADLYYSRSTTDTVVNGFSYDVNGVSAGTDVSVNYLNKSVLLPLSVEQIELSAAPENNDVKLDWDVKGEKETSKEYALSRSWDGEKFEQIAIIKATPNPSCCNKYNYTDANVALANNQVAFYRVSEIDAVGAVTNSNVVKVKFNNLAQFEVYPNPSTDRINVILADAQGTIELLDAKGSIVMKQVVDSKNTTINISGLAAGNYLLKANVAGTLFTKQISKID
jgi:hypothetical protein